MRIFQNYTFNLSKTVPFQETIGFVENFLNQNGIPFGKITFELDGWFTEKAKNRSSNIKILKKYPELLPYYYEEVSDNPDPRFLNNCISNLPFLQVNCPNKRDNSVASLPMPPKNIGIFKEIAASVPRPYSLYSCNIILDNIHWFDEINTAPASDSVEKQEDGSLVFSSRSIDTIGCHTYQSNCISIVKDPNKQRNRIQARIEVTSPNGTILDDTHIYEKLRAGFGEGMKETICVPDLTEWRSLLDKNAKIQPILDNAYNTLAEMLLPSGRIYNEDKQYRVEREQMNTGKAFKRVFKDDGFVYDKGHACQARIGKYNFRTRLSFSFTPGGRFDGFIEISGYNFGVYTYALAQHPPTQRDLEICMAEYKFITEYWENNIIELMYETYGATPNWHVYPKYACNLLCPAECKYPTKQYIAPGMARGLAKGY